jgi:hypothetical protein
VGVREGWRERFPGFRRQVGKCECEGEEGGGRTRSVWPRDLGCVKCFRLSAVRIIYSAGAGDAGFIPRPWWRTGDYKCGASDEEGVSGGFDGNENISGLISFEDLHP